MQRGVVATQRDVDEGDLRKKRRLSKIFHSKSVNRVPGDF